MTLDKELTETAVCLRCGYEWKMKDPTNPPSQCQNPKCRNSHWDTLPNPNLKRNSGMWGGKDDSG